jgi:hypothetical protein
LPISLSPWPTQKAGGSAVWDATTDSAWKRMRRYLDRWLPPARICHPWLDQRLASITQGKSRMR